MKKDQEKYPAYRPPNKNPTEKQTKAAVREAIKQFKERDIPNIEKRFRRDNGDIMKLIVNE